MNKHQIILAVFCAYFHRQQNIPLYYSHVECYLQSPSYFNQ